MKSIAEKLRRLRVEKGYSQEYVADYMRVSIATISRLENNHGEVKLRYLSTLAKLYEIELCNFFSNDVHKLEKELSQLTIQVNIPIDITAAQLFQIAKKLQETEQLIKR